MIPGVSFDDVHCFDDLGMILASKEIGSPTVQTRFLDVPGRNGPLDLTEALTGDVRYGSRLITLTFVTNDYISKQGWEGFLITVEDAIHGQRKEIIFDDGGYSYTGRCEINQFTTSWGKQTVTIGCTCDPIPIELDKFAFYSADDNSLNFQCGHLPAVGDTYKGKTVTNLYDEVESTGTNPGWYSMRSSVKAVYINASFAAAKPTSCNRWFYGMSSCTEITGLANLTTSEVTDMYNMFRDCSLVTSLDTGGWDTSKVTTMGYMFSNCAALTAVNVGGFDVANVDSMTYMFNGCTNARTIDVSRWKTSSVTSVSYMFYGCSSVTGLDFANWDISGVTTLSYFMRECSSLTELDISMLDTSGVTNMTYMFYGCTELTTIYSDDDVFVTSAVTSGGNMFNDCDKLVGGNGTAHTSTSGNTYTRAHVDTEENPGYFTDIKDK